MSTTATGRFAPSRVAEAKAKLAAMGVPFKADRKARALAALDAFPAPPAHDPSTGRFVATGAPTAQEASTMEFDDAMTPPPVGADGGGGETGTPGEPLDKGADKVQGGSDSTAPASANWIALGVTSPAGTTQLPLVWADAPGDDPNVAQTVGDIAAYYGPVAVTGEVNDDTVAVSGVGNLAKRLVEKLGEASVNAGYDGEPDSIIAKVPGITAEAIDGAQADSLVTGDGTVYQLGGDGTGAQPGDTGADDTGKTPDTGDTSDSEMPMSVSPDGRVEGVLIVEGAPSGDNRVINEGALEWRDLPLPLMAMFRNPEGGDGHDGAELAGIIEQIERRGNDIWGIAKLDLSGKAGQEAYRLMGGPVDSQGMPCAVDAGGKAGQVFMRGVSADLDRVEVTWENQLGDDAGIEEMLGFDPGRMFVTKGRIMGATLVPFPAFQEAQLSLVDDVADPAEIALAATAGYSRQAWVYTPWDSEALVASGGGGLSSLLDVPEAPPATWFAGQPGDDPARRQERLTELAELRAEGRAWKITDDGRIYGFAAIFGSLHIGTARPTQVPRSPSKYAHYRTGEVHCDDGTVVGTGPVVMDCVHPDLTWHASDAATFYHHTGAAVGDLAVWDDDEAGGIVIAGALRPGVTRAQLRTLRASDGVSPDWRRISGKRECVAMLVVNNSGFKTPALVASGGVNAGDYIVPGTFAVHFELGNEEPTAMVAAGTFATRRPDAAAGSFALAAQLMSLRQELRSTQGEVRELRRERARAKLDRLGITRTA